MDKSKVVDYFRSKEKDRVIGVLNNSAEAQRKIMENYEMGLTAIKEASISPKVKSQLDKTSAQPCVIEHEYDGRGRS